MEKSIMSDQDSVIYSEFLTASGHRLLVATLNAESSLNALTLDMIRSLRDKLDQVEKDPLTIAVWLQGSGAKAFCAGGDIRRLYQSMLSGNKGRHDGYAEKFFIEEYSCDYKLHSYSKPIICWGSGIVMGGGLGLFAGSRIRVVTESSKLAMPEISIGLYPDVGATWFLNQMPQGVGRFLALTGARMNAADAIYCGIATHFAKSEARGQIMTAIQNESFSMNAHENTLKLEEIFKGFHHNSSGDMGVSELRKHSQFIQDSFAPSSVEELSSFWKAHIDSSDPWIKASILSFFRGSPTSAHVIFEQLKRAPELKTIKEAFARELEMTLHFSRGHDLPEGVRALIIDKDNKPQWKPDSLKAVSPELVASYFESPWSEGQKNPITELTY